MKKWYCLIAVIMFTACQKGVDFSMDPGSGQTNNAIIGTWKFVSLSGNTQAATAYTQADSAYKSITYSNYTTTDSTGTISFTSDSSFNATGISYKLFFTANSYNYTNGILVDSNASLINYPFDSSNSNGTYELIGSDSIYFPKNFIFTADSSPTLVTPSGGKINISGNTLTITQVIYKDSTAQSGGTPYNIIESGTFVITLHKQ